MYLYHADALALGGAVTRPIQKDIPSQAACSLPTMGGTSTCQVGKTDIEGMISFDSAQSRVTGSVDQQPDGEYNVTSASVIIENLNILNVVMADQVVVRVAGRHAPKTAKQTKDGTPTESELVTIGCHFDRLRIAGHEVQITTNHELFSEMPTYKHWQNAWNGKKDVRDKVRGALIGSRLPKVTDGEPPHLKAVRDQETTTVLPSTIMSSFVSDVADINGPKVSGVANIKSPKVSGVKSPKVSGVANIKSPKVSDVADINSPNIGVWGPIIKIPHFGTIYLGEVLVSFGQRRVNMIRLELGSPDAGSFIFGTASGNGQPFP